MKREEHAKSLTSLAMFCLPFTKIFPRYPCKVVGIESIFLDYLYNV